MRVLVLLACVVSASCGGSSDPTAPSGTSSGGSTGGSGGSGTDGGSGTFRATATIADSAFDDNNWDDIVEAYSASGSGGGGHLNFNSQAGAGYRQINMHVTSVSGSDGKLAVFAINRQAVYFPSSDGALLWLDYSEASINQSTGVQYSAPAIRQNDKLYTLVPGGKAFPTPDASWTDHSLTHLTQNDFRTLASATDHPDFTSGRLEFGFVRIQAATGDTKAGIDNYRLVLYRN